MNGIIDSWVEASKKAMFSMVEKPGYEDIAKKMAENISKLERIRIDGS